MMIVSIATGMGLQKTIREKISAFNGHIIISSYINNNSDVSIEPISINQNFYPKFTNVDQIEHVQAVISKAGIIRTASDFEGIIYKGVGKDFEWKYIKNYLIAGRIPNLNSELNSEVVISQFLANRLHLKLNDNFNTFFLKQNENKLPNLRRFKIVGLYNSGFQEFDAVYVIGDHTSNDF